MEKFDDIEIIRDLSTGMRLVRIAKKYDKNVIAECSYAKRILKKIM